MSRAVPVVLVAILLPCPGMAWPESADAGLRQLNHREFTAVDGAPTDIAALAQTTDGTLWIGGRTGLTRFDGLRFVPFPESPDQVLGATNVSSLLATPDGSLWIGFRPGGVGLLKGGSVTRYTEEHGLPNGTVQQLAQGPDGSIWAAARTGLARFDGRRWEEVGEESGLSTPYGVLVDRTGTLWIATVDGLRTRGAGEKRFREIDRRVYSDPGGIILIDAPGDRMWAAADGELVRIDRPTRDGIVNLGGIASAPLLLDDDGYLWASVGVERILQRVSPRILDSGVDRKDENQVADHLHPRGVFALLQDRERNIWVGTNSGLHRFSRSNVVRDAAPTCLQDGFQAAVLVAADAGAVWMACDEGSAARISEIRNGTVTSREAPPVTVAYRDHDGTTWFGGPTVLGRVENGAIVSSALPANLQGRPVQALLREPGGAMWVSVTRMGTYRVVAGEWTENGGLDALPRSEFAHVISSGSDPDIWFGYTDNRIARARGRIVQLYDTTHGLEVGNVMAILADREQLWVGGELGLARFNGARFVPIRSASGTPFQGVSGIVRARNGDVWLNGSAGIVRIPESEIATVLRRPEYRVAYEIFNHLDGVPGTAVQLRPLPTAIEATDGRLWFSTTGGVVSIDATQLVRNTLAPPVTIWSLSTGSERYSYLGDPLQLPVHTTDLEIEYTAGSLTVPERVQFRYKLEGLDHAWHHAGPRREALYTNLGPGRYTFRISASNNDGIWNEAGTSMEFTIAPAFYQTQWFYSLCALLTLALVAAFYKLRMRQVSNEIRGRLEARLAERERIARDLHDTLLQGVQGLIWRFQAAANRIPPDEPARQLMQRSLDRADQLLVESRDKVKELRHSADNPHDLVQALAMEGEQLALEYSARFRVSVQGTPGELHPLVHEEGFMIAREALSNAFRHAHAAHIEAEMSFGHAALHVRIRDDGQGISAAAGDAGEPPGHFGLIGMRERAQKIGAHLEIWSKPGAGTEVDLRVPAAVAYIRPPHSPAAVRPWFASRHSPGREH